MIKEDMIITLEDNKDYYVMASLMNDEDNYIMIGEIDKEKEEISDNVKIMYYDTENNMVRKVTNPNALFQLTKLFAKQKQELEA
ncbi:unknown [Clostridium sp. CAG:1193]|nr:unknown [Clostridium sp. CAG:1193]